MTRASTTSLTFKVPRVLLLFLFVGLAAMSTGVSTARASHANWTGDGHRGYGWFVGDFDGDLDDDIFRQADQNGGAEVYLSDGTSQFVEAGQWTTATHNGYGWQIGDFNGDLADDIFRQINQYGGAEVFLSDAPNGNNRFVYAGQWTGAGHRGRWYIGDFNRDGADDLFRQVNQYGGAEVFLSDAPNGRNRFVSAGQWTGDGHRGFGWYVGDFDGDGADDIFRQQNEWGGAEVYLSNRTNAFVPSGTWTGSGHRGFGWYVGDFDGDGSDDIFRQQNEWGGAEVFLADEDARQFVCNGCGEDGWYWTGAGHRGYGWYLGDFDGRGFLPGIPAIDIFRQINEWGGAEMFLSGSFDGGFNCSQCGEALLAGTYTGTVTGQDGSAPATLTLGQMDTQITVTVSLTGPLALNPGALCGGTQTLPTGTTLGPVTATETSPGVVTGTFQVLIANNTINGALTLTLDSSGHSLVASVDLDLPFPCSNQSLTGTFTRP